MGHAPLQLKNKTLLLHYRLASRLEQIALLAAAVENALADRPDLAFAVNLCLEELITNTIQHGLQGAPDRQIQVRLSRSDKWLEVMLRDDAPPFDPFVQAPAPQLDSGVDERAVGGLGVHLVKSLMDDVRAFYDGSGNLIVLFKTLKPAEKEAR
ncbi:ATP-binding protein [Paucibacter sp. PLA-PC-4]|uniref:ATP-binding protein n=1 Tax=Paucibacter sp. PLA-PC-4 TaxID=2993655 RepID=UPI00224AC084|nr:ATP-binding protein [Paucibacter sp. PLA-PC-4]MCX2863473.1 ATP-binding protein [Paucibacter sp. PLA-PC-4]